MNKAFLAANLCFLHNIMRVSERLLLKAAQSTEGVTRAYLFKHLEEEQGHLDLLSQDLETLGVKTVLLYPEAAQFAGAQLYFIETGMPEMLLGYMLALESHGLTEVQVRALQEEYGPLPCTMHHAMHDTKHGEDIKAAIAKLPADVQQLVNSYADFVRLDYTTRCIPAMQRVATGIYNGI